MKATLFRFAWWLARKTAPGDRYNFVRVKAYNNATRVLAITLTEIEADDTPAALVDLAEGFAECSHTARQEAAKAELIAEVDAALIGVTP